MTESTEIDAVAEHFGQAPSVFDTSPLYQALCLVVASDRELLELLTRRRPGQQPSFLLFGAVHRLLLGGAEHRLRDYYPSMAGGAALDPAQAGPAFLDFCRQHRAPLAQLIASRLVQSNVLRRAIALRFALWAIGRRCDGPVHLIEVGASAGLLMNLDRYRFLIGGRAFGRPDAPVVLDSLWRSEDPVPNLDDVPEIIGKTGIDLHPRSSASTATCTGWSRWDQPRTRPAPGPRLAPACSREQARRLGSGHPEHEPLVGILKAARAACVMPIHSLPAFPQAEGLTLTARTELPR